MLINLKRLFLDLFICVFSKLSENMAFMRYPDWLLSLSVSFVIVIYDSGRLNEKYIFLVRQITPLLLKQENRNNEK